jgi:hypothetical protein
VAGGLELLQGRDLPPDVLSSVVGLLGHDDPLVVWTALAVLAGRHLPDALVIRGVSRLLEAPEVDARVLVRFLRGRVLPEQAALSLSSWVADDPTTRWLVAVELEWPERLAADVAANVRAMAAARAVDEVAAFDGLVAAAAEQWLSNATGESWETAAGSALAKLRARYPYLSGEGRGWRLHELG